MKIASPPEFLPRARAASAAAAPAALSISATTTLAPSSAKRSAVARPMPPPPPEMNATLPASLGAPAAMSDTEIFRLDLFIRPQVVGPRRIDDLALTDHVDIVDQLERKMRVLLDQQDGQAFSFELAD